MTNIVRRGTGLPLVLVHGNGVDHRLLLDLDDVFDETGQWERIYLDLPGFGGTPALPGRGGLPDVADWLDDMVGSVIGHRSFAMIGSSLGGLLVRDLVGRRFPQCLGFALLAPVVDPVQGNRTLPEPSVVMEDDALLESLSATDAEAYCEVAVVRTRDNWERFRRAALPGIRAADPDAMRRLGELYELPEPPDERLDGFEQPVLIIAGRQDAVVGYQDQQNLSELFPHATCAVLDQAGHNVHLDQPQTVRELLRNWLRRMEP